MTGLPLAIIILRSDDVSVKKPPDCSHEGETDGRRIFLPVLMDFRKGAVF